MDETTLAGVKEATDRVHAASDRTNEIVTELNSLYQAVTPESWAAMTVEERVARGGHTSALYEELDGLRKASEIATADAMLAITGKPFVLPTA